MAAGSPFPPRNLAYMLPLIKRPIYPMKIQPPTPMNQRPILIPLTKGLHAIIDAADFDKVSLYKWRAVKYHRSYYARSTHKTTGEKCHRSMHRLIAGTKKELVCHHRNRNTLDNRRDNLLNLTKNGHKFIHLNNSLIIKFEDSSSLRQEHTLGKL